MQRDPFSQFYDQFITVRWSSRPKTANNAIKNKNKSCPAGRTINKGRKIGIRFFDFLHSVLTPSYFDSLECFSRHLQYYITTSL